MDLCNLIMDCKRSRIKVEIHVNTLIEKKSNKKLVDRNASANIEFVCAYCLDFFDTMSFLDPH